jgi:outer membrane protein assembly factor BamD (BamD/ComL family)
MDSDHGGSIHGISLDAFLQMVQMEKSTCTLTVKSREGVGYLYISNGDLIAAETGDLKNVEAAHRIISWDQSEIDIENVCDKAEREIAEPLANILTEGLRLRDENILKQRRPQETITAKDRKKSEIGFAPPLPSDDSFAEALPETSTADASPLEGLSMEAPSVSDLPSPEPRVPRPEIPIQPEARVEEKPKVDPAEKLRRKRIMALCGAVAVMVCISVGAVYAIRAIKSHRIKRAYQNVLVQIENRQTLEEKELLLKNFINSHESSDVAVMAEGKIKEIQKRIEKRDFQELMHTVNNLQIDEDFPKKAKVAYSQFLEAHPNSIYTSQIEQKISEIPDMMDDIDYEKLKELSPSDLYVKLSAYNRYLTNHPHGKHRKAVQQFISDMSETFYEDLKKEINECDVREKWESCIELCSFFISSFPEHRRWDEVVVLKNEMQAKNDLSVLAERANLEGTDYEAAKQVYLAYLEKHPDSAGKRMIMDELEKLDKKIAGKKEWEKVAAYSEDGQYHVSARRRKLKDYIDRNPTGVFVADAKKMLKQLDAEKQRMIRESPVEAKEPSTAQVESSSVQGDSGRIQREREKVRSQLKLTGRFVANGDGTFTDSMTGLMWVVLDSHIELNKCLNHDDATQYVENLTTGGYRDWRLPTASDLAGIYKNHPFFPDSGASWYWTSKIYVDGHHRRAAIVTSKKETVFKREYADVEKCGAVRAVRP